MESINFNDYQLLAARTRKMFEDKKDLIKLVFLYGTSVLVYANPQELTDKKLQTQIKNAFKERLKVLKEKGASVNKINLEKYQFETVMQEILTQAQNQNNFGNSY